LATWSVRFEPGGDELRHDDDLSGSDDPAPFASGPANHDEVRPAGEAGSAGRGQLQADVEVRQHLDVRRQLRGDVEHRRDENVRVVSIRVGDSTTRPSTTSS